MRSRLSPVLTPADLPVAELSSARLDGELFGLGDFWCPIDVRDEPETRALSLARLLPRRAIAELQSAAWIYGVAPEPARHSVCLDTRARAVIASSPRIRVRELRRVSDDTQLVGGLGVTTPLRTAIDFARTTEPMSLAVPHLLARLLRYGGFSSVDPVFDGFVAHSRAEARRALDRLTLAQVLLDEHQTEPLRLTEPTEPTEPTDLPGPPADTDLAVADPVHVVDGVNASHSVQDPIQVSGVTHFENKSAERQPGA